MGLYSSHLATSPCCGDPSATGLSPAGWGEMHHSGRLPVYGNQWKEQPRRFSRCVKPCLIRINPIIVLIIDIFRCIRDEDTAVSITLSRCGHWLIHVAELDLDN